MADIINLDEKRQQLKLAQDDEDVVATIVIRRSSSTSVWISDDINGNEGFNWLHRRITEGAILATEIEAGRKP